MEMKSFTMEPVFAAQQRQSAFEMDKDHSIEVDFLILGLKACSLQLANMFQNVGLRYLIVEEGGPSKVKNLELIHLNIRYGSQILFIDKRERYHLIDQTGVSYYCKTLCLAQHLTIPYCPNIPGFQLALHYPTGCPNLSSFQGKKVLVVGEDQRAVTLAQHLAKNGAMAQAVGLHGTQLPGYPDFPATDLLHSEDAILKARILEIRLKGKTYTVLFKIGAELHETAYDTVVNCCGNSYDDAVFTASCRPKLTLTDRLPLLNSHWESVNNPGMFFLNLSENSSNSSLNADLGCVFHVIKKSIAYNQKHPIR